MNQNEIARVQHYLRKILSNNQIKLVPSDAPDAPVEMMIGEEFFAALYKDDEEGEISFALHATILDEDLPHITDVI
jgi:Protein of unknown function (DUF3126)